MKPGRLSDPDIRNAEAALIRAAARARLIAQQTGTAIVVVRDGKLVREIPQPAQEKRSRKKAT